MQIPIQVSSSKSRDLGISGPRRSESESQVPLGDALSPKHACERARWPQGEGEGWMIRSRRSGKKCMGNLHIAIGTGS